MEEFANKNDESKVSFEGNEWILPTTLKVIDEADEALVKKLEEAGWNSDEVKGLELGFHEALVNAIAHGNFGIVRPEGSTETSGQLVRKKQESYATNKKVYITIDVNKDRVYLKIRDEGKGFNIREIPDSAPSKDSLDTKGRGLYYMKAYFDSVTYNEKGNEVTMIKERKK